VARPTWAAPRIHGELLKLGIDVSQTTVSKYMVRRRKPPFQTWRAFLDNHVKQLVSIDFFVVPTIDFKLLFVFLVLAHERRRIIHFNVTHHPTAAWAAQQLLQAFPWDPAPHYLLRDRDSIYGETFRGIVASMGISEVLTAPRSSWQSPYVERLIGSIRRKCLDQYSRWVMTPGCGTGYLPSGPATKGAGDSIVSLSTSGANSWEQLRMSSKVTMPPV